MTPVDVLEGIASFSTATVATVTWETATDWDNAVAENGIIHEASQTGFDTPGADVLAMGYPSYDIGGTNLKIYYPMNEDSSGPIHDLIDNNDASEIGGPTYQNTGPWGRDAPGYDGSDDGHQTGDPSAAADISTGTLLGWWYPTSSGNRRNAFRRVAASGGLMRWKIDRESDDSLRFQGGDGNNNWSYTGGTVSTNTWSFWACTVDGSRIKMWLNDTKVVDTSDSRTMGGSQSEEIDLANRGGGEAWPGRTGYFRVYDRVLSETEVVDRYNWATAGDLTTATKSFSSNQQPDLQNLVYSLNGETITLDVIGSPGTASEEIVSQTLDGSTGYTLTWSSGHTDFRVKVNMSTSAVTATTPTLSKVELVG